MCLVAIEPPNILDANTVRDEKLKVLKLSDQLMSIRVKHIRLKGNIREVN